MSQAAIPVRPFVLVVGLDLADTASGGYALDQAGRIGLRIPGSQLHVLHVAAGESKPDTLALLRQYANGVGLAPLAASPTV